MTRYTTRPIAWAVGPEGAALYSERVTVIEPHSTPAQFPRRACRTGGKKRRSLWKCAHLFTVKGGEV